MYFSVNYCEYNRANADGDRIFRSQGSGDYLFLLWKTPMKCRVGGRLTVTGENACILYRPGTSQDYQAVRKFCNSFLHFATDLAFEETYRIPTDMIFYPPNVQEIDRRIQEIQQEYLTRAPHYQERLRILTEDLFLGIARALAKPAYGEEEDEPLAANFRKLRLKMLKNCEQPWTVERLCGMANMGKSQFYHYYARYFHAAPKAELLQTRLEKAGALLTNEAILIQEAARQCGFSNMSYFSRVFREKYHCSPQEWKRRGGRGAAPTDPGDTIDGEI